MTILAGIQLEKAIELEKVLSAEVDKLKARKEAEIAECVKTKTSIGKDYWEACWHAERRLDAVRRLIQALS